jgi:murein L,D-transpeptidase YcbB/YkuD
MARPRTPAALLAALFVFAGCAAERPRVATPVPPPVAVPAPAPAVTTPLPEVETLNAALQARLAIPVIVCGASRLDTRLLAPFYPASDAPPLWITRSAADARARELLAMLRLADREGLPAAHYRLADIERFWAAQSAGELACLDLLLTDAFRRYSSDLRRGQLDPREADADWHLRPEPFDPAGALAAADGSSAFHALLQALPPPAPGYQRLRAALAHYDGLARGGWAPLPPGPKLEPGMRHAQVALLRARLQAEGDLGTRLFGARDVYDTTLVTAVQRFQRRHGLGADGIVGPRTRAALDVPAAERAAQLRRAMERWRWLPREPGGHYVWVNTAGFELAVIEQGRTVLRMRAIVGTPDQATPSFAATLESLVINPYWNIPARIARDKLLAKQQANPRYFASREIRVFSNRNGQLTEVDPATVSWARLNSESFPYRLRQEPGPKNSMGRLAFVITNPFDVFLHNTPEQALFERDVRTFSEGCVRIEDAMTLALHALRNAPDWDGPRLEEAIDSLRNQKLALPEPIPVYVLYLPAWVDDAGLVHFAADVYQRETQLAIAYPPVPAAK